MLDVILKRFDKVEHVGLVLSGRATAAMKDGKVVELSETVAK
jgi:hypothetical protein